MGFPEAYLSRPAVVFPEQRLDNEELVRRIRERYRGAPEQWPIIEAGVRTVFRHCNSQYRYIEADETVRVADFAARAARDCLAANGVAPDEVDVVIYGGIAREYFEPATAMEVAAKVGVGEPVHAFDVTSACSGLLEAVHIGCAYLAMKEQVDTVLVASGELTRKFLSYDIQSPDELITKVAGLTIGNAAAAWLLRRKPFPGGSVRLLAADNYSLVSNWGLCHAPIDGTFSSFSHDLFKLNVHVPAALARVLGSVGWQLGDVKHFVCHQPSDHMVSKVMADMGIDPERAVRIHHLYGNTASTTVPIAMHQLLKERQVLGGDKMVLTVAAAGFSVVTALGEWVA